ncbi:SH3 and cysteine-rich domain-containing protein 2-like isoform X1 [Synchiropus splendidus]|uniref:SH3 and cysteine-rich domain-containing protein 2-like isoform X1 n=1 Tax=Synchiropus splendidus TaxID=270530 RepID=UPI00237E3F52|nr:SH3 and cysteine-rich domain-containing protein 2-like isoform X1 [Synchiropus splendidus]
MMTENNEMESDTQLQRSPSTVPIQPVSSKLQRLKRSLSFKTIMRSKSVENFFQRSYSDARLPSDFITDPPPPSPPLLPSSPLVGEHSPSMSPSISPNPSISSHSPSLSLSPSLPVKPQITHYFQDHVFRKPTNCQHCKHMIVGNSKQALRCKTCKMAAHLWCTSEVSQQPCHGKSGAFKRNFSSPMLVTDQLAVVKEVPPSQVKSRSPSHPPTWSRKRKKIKRRNSSQPEKAVRTRVDPVYAALRFGTSLAQMSRSSFGSLSESPTRSLGEGGDERQQRQSSMEEEISQEAGGKRAYAPVPDAEAEKEEEEVEVEEVSGGQAETTVEVPKRIEVHSIHTYVALYKFLPQEHNDLELHPGDRVQVTDDSNEEWWKGKCGDKVGFFPSNFVQRVRPGERVWRVIQGNPGNRERGHMAVRESQICVGKREEGEAFLRLSSGKKRGLVAADSIEEI